MKKYATKLAGFTPRFSAWFAACIALPCVLSAAPALAASFDCSKGGSANEKIICNDPELSALDDKLGKTFKQARKKAPNRRAFNAASDVEWRWREQNCHDRTCLVDWYHKRQTMLEAALTAPAETAQSDAPSTAETKAATPAKPPALTKAKPETAVAPVVAATAPATVAAAMTPSAKKEPKVAAVVAPAAAPAAALETAPAAAKTPEPKVSKPAALAAATKVAPVVAPAIASAPAATPDTAQAAAVKTPEPKVAKPAKLVTVAKTTPVVAAAPVVVAPAAQPAPAAKEMLQLQLSQAQIAGIAPEGVSARAHYVSANKGEYLYADTEAGADARATVSVRYLGTDHGQHIIEVKRKDVYTRYTCSADCALIGKLQLPGDADTDMVILKNDHKSLPSLIVTDALNGLLLESVVVR